MILLSQITQSANILYRRKLNENGDLKTLYTHLTEILKGENILPQIKSLILEMDEEEKIIKIKKQPSSPIEDKPINRKDLGYVKLTDIHNEEENKHYFEFVLEETENPKVHIMLGTKKIGDEDKYQDVDKLAQFISDDLAMILTEEEKLNENFKNDIDNFNKNFLKNKDLTCKNLEVTDLNSVVYNCENKEKDILFQSEFLYLEDINHYQATLKCKQNVYEVFLNNLKPILDISTSVFKEAQDQCKLMNYSTKSVKDVYNQMYKLIVEENMNNSKLVFENGTKKECNDEKHFCAVSLYDDSPEPTEEKIAKRMISRKLSLKSTEKPKNEKILKISKVEKWGNMILKKKITIHEDLNQKKSPRSLNYKVSTVKIKTLKYNFLGQLYFQVYYSIGGTENVDVRVDYLIPASDINLLEMNMSSIEKDFQKILALKKKDDKDKEIYNRKEIHAILKKDANFDCTVDNDKLQDIDEIDLTKTQIRKCKEAGLITKILNEDEEEEYEDEDLENCKKEKLDEIWTKLICTDVNKPTEEVINIKYDDDEKFLFVFHCKYIDNGSFKNYHSEIVLPKENVDMSLIHEELIELTMKMRKKMRYRNILV